MIAQERHPHIFNAQEFSRRSLKRLTGEFPFLSDVGASLVVNGSYARLEASAISDFDYFLLVPPGVSNADTKKLCHKVKRRIVDLGINDPSSDGAFGAVERPGIFAHAIGGIDDDNHSITRRILFLTEGRAVIGRELFDNERDSTLKKYVRDTISDHQLGLFLLNDIIRFYRTMCVDFENKTIQNGKPWGIRNIKLVFSRKMLYFGGVLICAEMAQKTYAEKIRVTTRLMEMSPLERLVDVCGAAAERALKEYDHFLGEISVAQNREALMKIGEDRDTHTEYYKCLKNRGHNFTHALMSALQSAYPVSHPIHRALVM